jgi:uncharacterized protein with HEPN domain
MKHPERVFSPYQPSQPFQQNLQVQDAVVRNIEIIGEAVNKINSTAPARKCTGCAT